MLDVVILMLLSLLCICFVYCSFLKCLFLAKYKDANIFQFQGRLPESYRPLRSACVLYSFKLASLVN